MNDRDDETATWWGALALIAAILFAVYLFHGVILGVFPHG